MAMQLNEGTRGMAFSGSRIFIYDLNLRFKRPELVEFLAYWNAKRGKRRFPSRADMVQRDLVRILPWVHMYDVLNVQPDGSAEFRVRLLGTALSEIGAPVDYRGKLISAMPPVVYENLQEHLDRVLQARAPMRTYTNKTSIPGQEFQSSESCYAPLSKNGADIDVIIVVTMLEKRK